MLCRTQGCEPAHRMPLRAIEVVAPADEGRSHLLLRGVVVEGDFNANRDVLEGNEGPSLKVSIGRAVMIEIPPIIMARLLGGIFGCCGLKVLALSNLHGVSHRLKGDLALDLNNQLPLEYGLPRKDPALALMFGNSKATSGHGVSLGTKGPGSNLGSVPAGES